jgi:hypothetical protein
MNAITRRIFTPTLAAFVLLLGLAGPVSAVEIVDGCDDGIPDPADIEKLTATFDGGTGKMTVVLDLCGNTDTQTKYRIHLDHTAPFAGDSPIDCRGDSDPDLCCTTSDDTMMTRVHRGSTKDTGPGMTSVSGDMITYMVTLAELGLDANMLPPEILIWADTQFKGISDRAPNTEWGDGCAKPESSTEVFPLVGIRFDRLCYQHGADGQSQDCGCGRNRFGRGEQHLQRPRNRGGPAGHLHCLAFDNRWRRSQGPSDVEHREIRSNGWNPGRRRFRRPTELYRNLS